MGSCLLGLVLQDRERGAKALLVLFGLSDGVSCLPVTKRTLEVVCDTKVLSKANASASSRGLNSRHHCKTSSGGPFKWKAEADGKPGQICLRCAARLAGTVGTACHGAKRPWVPGLLLQRGPSRLGLCLSLVTAGRSPGPRRVVGGSWL